MDEHRVLRDVKPQIIFGTPGRLNDHLDKENISRYSIRYLVIDEFDKCLEMGFQAEMQKLADTAICQYAEEGDSHRLPGRERADL